VLQLTFPFTPTLDQTITVQPDGFITLRSIGDVRAAARTLPELTEALRGAYEKILRDPVINVDLKDFAKPSFVVGGEVGHPGKFELRGDTTIVEALSIAGGLRDTAKHSQVLLFRPLADGMAQAQVIDVKKMIKQREFREDIHLQPGDILYVPKNALSKIKPFVPVPGLGVGLDPTRF